MKKTLILTLTFASLAHMASAQLLIDRFGNGTAGNPTSSANWANAGVTEDLSAAAGGTIAGGVFNLPGLTQTVTGGVGGGGALTFTSPTSAMLNGYLFGFGNGGSTTISLGGFVDGNGVAQTLTTSAGAPYVDLRGNSFTLQANQTYKLYLFGAGDKNNQNAAFTFNGVTKTTNPLIVGTAPDAGHSVTFEFTTGADLTGFTLDFTINSAASNVYAFNGLALVAVNAAVNAAADADADAYVDIPEPASFAFLSGLLGLGLMAMKRRRSVK
jgi:hypothetical protein